MSQEDVTDEMLMALSDGELSDADAAALRARIAADANLAARFDAFEGSRAAAQIALQPIADAAAPDRLVAAIRGFRARDHKIRQFMPKPRTRRAFAPMSIAASLALAVFAGGLGGYLLRGGAAGDAAWSAGPAIAQRDLFAALSHAPSDRPRPWRAGGETGAIAMLGTFRLEDGEACRAFEVTGAEETATGLACGAGGDWRIVLASVEPMAEAGYAPASAGAFANLDAFLDARGGERLEPGQEAALIARAWRGEGQD